MQVHDSTSGQKNQGINLPRKNRQIIPGVNCTVSDYKSSQLQIACRLGPRFFYPFFALTVHYDVHAAAGAHIAVALLPALPRALVSTSRCISTLTRLEKDRA
ncbi:MAG TPA: hypothetical protein VG105_15115 [Paraburkholderia sp.]|jgi:hypothetical protein|nr:hypothetical protein [Paraburkholderia sp.]